ncbi:NAD-dependent epimerase/dehydratase family protein [Mucilaginibacter sp. UYCu711]|uniref:NAD-dependent epimerase/dehydratase family protein n=1 Tax=Mucilaginibacter sp. UYCu711 TaxID=3156339 RepID=UPI003D224FCE
MMNILLTGANGFLGKHIYSAFSDSHVIHTLGKSGCTINVDISISEPILLNTYDLIIHSAGKAHTIPKTQAEKQIFFDINLHGSMRLLKALEKLSNLPQFFIFISSVAVYGIETGNLINENASLIAKDAYGQSKIEAERIIQDWCKKNQVICTILRLPLIAGPNPPGNLKAMIKGIDKGYYFNIAKGKAKKSIVLAEDVAKIIPVAANIGGIYNLTDGYHPSFSELSLVIAQQLNKSKPLNIPMWVANLIAKIGDLGGTKAAINSNKLVKITSNLTFDDTKAQKLLGWKPTPVLSGFKIGIR